MQQDSKSLKDRRLKAEGVASYISDRIEAYAKCYEILKGTDLSDLEKLTPVMSEMHILTAELFSIAEIVLPNEELFRGITEIAKDMVTLVNSNQQ
jgi:hypothetical protein